MHEIIIYIKAKKDLIMSKNKGTRITVTLECTCRNLDMRQEHQNIFRYTTSKNRRNSPNRMELKKFCPKCRIHTVFKEIK